MPKVSFADRVKEFIGMSKPMQEDVGLSGPVRLTIFDPANRKFTCNMKFDSSNEALSYAKSQCSNALAFNHRISISNNQESLSIKLSDDGKSLTVTNPAANKSAVYPLERSAIKMIKDAKASLTYVKEPEAKQPPNTASVNNSNPVPETSYNEKVVSNNFDFESLGCQQYRLQIPEHRVNMSFDSLEESLSYLKYHCFEALDQRSRIFVSNGDNTYTINLSKDEQNIEILNRSTGQKEVFTLEEEAEKSALSGYCIASGYCGMLNNTEYQSFDSCLSQIEDFAKDIADGKTVYILDENKKPYAFCFYNKDEGCIDVAFTRGDEPISIPISPETLKEIQEAQEVRAVGDADIDKDNEEIGD